MATTRAAQLAIIGMPGTGKTTLADAMAEALNTDVAHTDMFKDLAWEDQAEASMDLLRGRHRPLILEGITVARMFRRGFLPDCVLHLAGRGTIESPQLLSLITNGLLDYDTALVRGHVGRVIHCPERPALETVLFLMGTLGPED